MTEFITAADGVRIAYETAGRGTTIVLVHGFASSRKQNWIEPGWFETLTKAGYRVVAMDCRGHGDSDKPHEPAAYDHAIMAEDVVAVMEAAHAAPCFLMGYSMGGFICMHVLMDHPELLRKLILGGVGSTYFGRSFGLPDTIAEALLATDKSAISDPVGKSFREFAKQDGKDRVALAACMRANRRPFTPAELKLSKRPVLVVCGEEDEMTGPPGPLADAFADGRAVVVPRRNHMQTVGDKLYKKAVLDFLDE